MTTRSNIIAHYNTYPKLQISDLFKYLYQSSFGCEHLVSSYDKALEYVKSELEKVENQGWKIDALDGNYSRVHLCCITDDLDAETLTKYFCLSAKKEPFGMEDLVKKLKVTRELVKSGLLPFSIAEFDKAVSEWREAGYPAIHHSDEFRKNYSPAYRVIANEYLDMLRINP